MTDTLFPMPLPGQRHSLFFAAKPPADVSAAFAEAWREQGSGDRFRADKLHMTLYCATEIETEGEAPDGAIIAALREAGAGVTVPPLTLIVDELDSFPVGRGLALVFRAADANDQASMLMDQLRRACLLAGIRPPKGAPTSITPHVTAAYCRRALTRQRLQRPISWTIDRIHLIDSLIGRATHVDLGHWPLSP